MASAKRKFKEANRGVGINDLLETTAGIMALLQNLHALESTNTGDYRVCDILIDFQAAINAAKLTNSQRAAVNGTIDGLTQDELAAKLGITQQAVQQHLHAAIGKIVVAGAKPGTIPIVEKRQETPEAKDARLEKARIHDKARRVRKAAHAIQIERMAMLRWQM